MEKGVFYLFCFVCLYEGEGGHSLWLREQPAKSRSNSAFRALCAPPCGPQSSEMHRFLARTSRRRHPALVPALHHSLSSPSSAPRYADVRRHPVHYLRGLTGLTEVLTETKPSGPVPLLSSNPCISPGLRFDYPP